MSRKLYKKKTKDQSKCDDWFAERKFRLTSSKFGDICKRKKKFGNLVFSIFCNI
jgi:hypothetical protein